MSAVARRPTEEDAQRHVREFFDAFAAEEGRWARRTSTYHAQIESLHRFHIPPGASVLEIGCGSGDLLAALEPSRGVGVDLSPAMVERACDRHPGLEFVAAAGEELDLGETFDYVVLSDLVPYVHDLTALFRRVGEHCDEHTRVVVHSYSQVWRPLIRLAERLRLKPAKPIRNWVSPQDVRNLFALAGFEVLTGSSRILLPLRVPLLDTFLNGILGSLWPFRSLSLTYWLVARPLPAAEHEPLTVSVVCPCRNESGTIRRIIEALPELGAATELVFVEGGSTDDTAAEIERQIALHPERDLAFVRQPGRGKADAVRAGFEVAKHEVLMILDGDVSVLPEELPKFYDALVAGRGELINGSRFVYDREPGSMRFLNLLGNRLFTRLLNGIVGQHVKDTLCGTKVLRRRDYERIAESRRRFFGDFDPFGDFDLLFGAGRLGLKIVDVPVRYQPRTYGATNISRFRHGLLLAQMTGFAFWKFRVEPVHPRRRR